ncbi:hypothetical protein [Ruminococcus sp.]|uniref:hypothetical protein n=1 Tax=Ruminococcus sp. TaxID=41978 RepID=UPI002583DE22|nr:hypothetical protein [Ruminococcus sp.]
MPAHNKIKLRFTFDETIDGLVKGQIYDAVKCDEEIGRLPAVRIIYADGFIQLCPIMWFDLVENYTYYIDVDCTFDSLILYSTLFKKIRMVGVDNNVIIAEVTLYESEWDSVYGMACIGLSNGRYYNQDEIRSIRII